MPTLDACELTLVEWLDSRQSDGGWRFVRSFEAVAPVKCVTVGWVVHDDGETLVLAQSFGDIGDEDMQVAGLKTIPCRAVTRRVAIEEQREDDRDRSISADAGM